MTKDTVAGFLLDHAGKSPISFHMPGHKGGAIYSENGYGRFIENIIACDITEIPGADNLFQTEGIIRETMGRYKALYDVKESYLLINGSSSGLVAAIMASVPEGGKIIMARNCHKAVFNGINLVGAEPVYAYPEIIDRYSITGEVTAVEIRRCIEKCPDASAILLPSPNYYGICSDIKAIAELAHESGMTLIVDQAHGAHLRFFDEYLNGPIRSAEKLGADIVINSTHKTLASLTQTAVANICSDRVDKYAFEDGLQKMESTSPSYVMMASLDINADLLEKRGQELMKLWRENLDYFYDEADTIEGLDVMLHPMLDDSKINLNMSAFGLNGIELQRELMDRNIYPELCTGNIVMCMSGIGNKRYDYEALISALKDIAKGRESKASESRVTVVLPSQQCEQRPIPRETVKLQIGDAAGRTCAQSIIPYPPGIPIACPGEVLTNELIKYVKELRNAGENVMGIDDKGRVIVGK